MPGSARAVEGGRRSGRRRQVERALDGQRGRLSTARSRERVRCPQEKVFRLLRPPETDENVPEPICAHGGEKRTLGGLCGGYGTVSRRPGELSLPHASKGHRRRVVDERAYSIGRAAVL